MRTTTHASQDTRPAGRERGALARSYAVLQCRGGGHGISDGCRPCLSPRGRGATPPDGLAAGSARGLRLCFLDMTNPNRRDREPGQDTRPGGGAQRLAACAQKEPGNGVSCHLVMYSTRTHITRAYRQ